MPHPHKLRIRQTIPFISESKQKQVEIDVVIQKWANEEWRIKTDGINWIEMLKTLP